MRPAAGTHLGAKCARLSLVNFAALVGYRVSRSFDWQSIRARSAVAASMRRIARLELSQRLGRVIHDSLGDHRLCPEVTERAAPIDFRLERGSGSGLRHHAIEQRAWKERTAIVREIATAKQHRLRERLRKRRENRHV